MKSFFIQILFAEPIEILDILPWIVVALAVGVLVYIVVKCISLYRKLKSDSLNGNNKTEQTDPLLSVRGEYFVLGVGVEYSVGADGQLRAGKYLLRGDGYDTFQISLNGEEKQLYSNDIVDLNDGDKLIATSCDLLTKPYQEEMKDNTKV